MAKEEEEANKTNDNIIKKLLVRLIGVKQQEDEFVEEDEEEKDLGSIAILLMQMSAHKYTRFPAGHHHHLYPACTVRGSVFSCSQNESRVPLLKPPLCRIKYLSSCLLLLLLPLHCHASHTPRVPNRAFIRV